MAEVFSIPTTLDYPTRLQALRDHGIAVWDVLASGVRPGSLDASIDLATGKPNDFPAFFDQLPQLRHIVFNGALAETLFTRRVLPTMSPEHQSLARLRLPSTSPANASVPPAVKLAIWRAALMQR